MAETPPINPIEDAVVNCDRKKSFHFTISFYSDQELTIKVMDVNTEEYWMYFSVNGVPMASTGSELCEGECIRVEFKLPPNASSKFDPLFNKKLWVVVGAPKVTFLVDGEVVPAKAQIIIVLDESGSMQAAHDWIPNMVRRLEAKLMDQGIGPNDYAMIGYGGYYAPPYDGQPRLFTFTTEGHPTPFTSSESLCEFIEGGGTMQSGAQEDGYLAMSFAWDSISAALDPNACSNMILITDEDRDEVESIDISDLTGEFVSRGTKLNAVVNCQFIASTGQKALGVSYDQTAYVAIPEGDNPTSYIEVEGASATTSFGTTVDDYVDFAWGINGQVWDMQVLKKGGAAAEIFTEVFVNVKVDEVVGTLTCIAEAEEREPFEWYCPRESNDPGFKFSLVGADNGCAHVRITFYADADRTSVVHSAFSLRDQRRWFILSDGVDPCIVNTDGVVISDEDKPFLEYVPELQPLSYMENQPTFTLTDTVSDTPLLCGVKYYVTVDLLYASAGNFVKYGDYEYIFECGKASANEWRENWDAKNWISSGQGKQDYRISRTSGQATNSSVAANYSGQFAIAWQDFRNSDSELRVMDYNPQIYYAIWDMVDDTIWATGMGNYDGRLFAYGFKPSVTTDSSGIFYFSSRRVNNITGYSGPIAPAETVSTAKYMLTDDRTFDLNAAFNESNTYLKARIHEPDKKGSFVVNKGLTVSVVEDCLVRLEVVGVPGTYAVRVRNEDDSAWSDWINIDAKRPDVAANLDNTTATDDKYLSAYFIDDDRFIVPWFLSAGTGMKRVCIQVMTFYGVSKTFCVDVMSNVRELDYDVRYYKTYSSGNFSDEVLMYKGYPVISGTDAGTPIYVRVEFKDKQKIRFYINKVIQIERYTQIADVVSGSGGNVATLTFNVVQQGINDQLGLPLVQISEGIYQGQFVVVKSDGIYNKDGLAAIVVNIPNPCTKTNSIPCGSNSNDPYNPMTLSLLRDFYVKYDMAHENLTPQSLLSLFKSSGKMTATNMNELKELYDIDDTRFIFANPKFFVNKSK